jgi:hypothetical protein
MASGVNVKMGVTGVAQFKADINTAKQSLKTLDEQLTLTEKEYKATGDAEAYMQRKTEQLQSKLETQQRICKDAEDALEQMRTNGVDMSSKAFQEMLRTLTKAKGEMIDTQTELQNIGSSAGDAKDGAEKMNSELKNIGKGVGWDEVTQGLGNIISKLENGARAAINFGKKIADSAMGSTGWADDILHLADIYGTDAETIQKMKNVSEFIETDLETIMNARSRLAKNKDSLPELLGFSADGMTVEQAFWKAGEAIQGMTDEFQKEEAAQKVFGRGWKELIPLFSAGQEEYNRQLAETDVLTNAQVEALGKADDSVKEIQQQVELMKNQFWAENADKLTELLQWLIDNKDGVVTAVGAIGVAFGGLKLAEMALNVGKLIDGFQKLGVLKGAGEAGAAGASGATSAAGGLGMAGLGGLAGLGLIGASAAWAVDRRINHADLVRGTDENLAARTQGVNDLLRDYILAQRAAESDDILEKSEEEVDAIFAKVQETYDALIGAEGGKDALQAYSDWRQENALGNMDWELPEAIDKMNQAAEELTGGSDKQKQSSSEMSTAANTLKGMPAEVYDAILKGFSNVKIYIDGQQAGSALTPYVNSSMAGILMTLNK